MFALLILAGLRAVHAQSSLTYALLQEYNPQNFFDGFDFYSAADPTNGFVQYVNQSYAMSSGMATTNATTVRIGVDHNTTLLPTSPGRPSVRISSQTQFTHGLVILSLNHMPQGCGTWPAFWSLGPSWPSNGEIDIIEGVNLNQANLFSLHTSANCTVAGSGQTGTLLTNDCFWLADNNVGCGTLAPATAKTYGESFNAAGGGIYAMEWTSNAIQIWFFPHSSAPPSIATGTPDTSTFGIPSALFAGSCDIDSHFANHQLVFDTTFCGDWAGNVYGSTTCPMTAGQGGYQSCIDFVAANPAAFAKAYWEINYLRIYQAVGGASSTTGASSATLSTTSLSSATPVISTAPISSSLVSVGMGDPSSSLPSSSLVLPSSVSTSSTATGSGSKTSTYRGPNTDTASSSKKSSRTKTSSKMQSSSSGSSSTSRHSTSSSHTTSASTHSASSSKHKSSTSSTSTTSPKTSSKTHSQSSSSHGSSASSSHNSTSTHRSGTRHHHSHAHHSSSIHTVGHPLDGTGKASTQTAQRSGSLYSESSASLHTIVRGRRTTTVTVRKVVAVESCAGTDACPAQTAPVPGL